MRPVRDTRRVEGNIALVYPLTAHKITVDIVKDLIGVYVGMVVWRRDGLGMVVVQPRAEGADHKGTGLKGLVHRRRLVYPPRYGLKIVDGKRIRIIIPVPAHDIERMGGVDQVVQMPLFLDLDQEISGFIMGLKFVTHLDPESQAKQKAEYDAKEKERTERAAARAKEVLARKVERAALAEKIAKNAQAEMEGRPLPHPEVAEQEAAKEKAKAEAKAAKPAPEAKAEAKA